MSYPVIEAYGRTACTRARKGGLHDVHPVDYSAECLKGVIAKVPYVEEHPEIIGDVITGCAMHINQMNMNASRLIVNRAGLPDAVPAQTINRFCSSGLQAISTVANAITAGQYNIGIGGGVELLDQNAAHDIVRGFLGHLALGDLLVQGGGQLVLMTLCACGAGSIHQSGVALRCENLSNTAAHCTCAKYCYFHDCSS